MVAPTSPTDLNYGEYAARLVHRMRQLHIQPPRQLRRRLNKAYVMERNGIRETVSIDRLKPSHLEETVPSINGPSSVASPATPVPKGPAPSNPINLVKPLEQAPDPDPPHQTTSRGKVLKLHVRFAL
ncbi:unnamed protein product [Echinostoma caproni]|uniref:Complex I-B14.5a n=1 Tax=Echinostoma caproni TaxID=27848 RepID=A0A182ZZS2_9TREM|nr:unnamed protein product [Echinostoma caproni]